MSTHITLPKTDLSVSRLCLGTGGIGTSIDLNTSPWMLDRFVELGGNFIDTAHNYGDWVADIPRSISEKTIGAWMKSTGIRDKVVLATKGGHPKFDKPEIGRLGRADLSEDIDGSLESLQTDVIDLYWLHADEKSRPVEEIMENLWEHQAQGKLRYLGASNWLPSRIRAANDYAQAQGKPGFVADQVLWNAAVLRTKPYGSETTGWMNAERFAYLEEAGLSAIPYQSQAFGLFNRMHAGTLDKMNPGFRGFYLADSSAERFARMTEIMAETGLTISQVVLGYLSSQSIPTVPIIGCQNLGQLADSMSVLEVTLSPEQLFRIDQGQRGSEVL